jgi:hypothetical protein
VSDREGKMSRPTGIYASTLSRRGRALRRLRRRRLALLARATTACTAVACAGLTAALAERLLG